MTAIRVSRSLLELARLYDVLPWHKDGFNRRHQPGEETLLAILKALDAGVERTADAEEAVRRRRSELADIVVEPALVSWSDSPPSIMISLPGGESASRSVGLAISGDNVHEARFSSRLEEMTVEGDEESDGRRKVWYRWTLPGDVPGAIYDCALELAGETHRFTLLRSPVRAAELPEIAARRKKGLFLPTYAIRSDSSWGMGDYSDLRRLIDMAGEASAGAVGTLPLLPVFEDDPSPYSPTSRLAWNELFVDPRAAPELASCDAARRIVESSAFSRDVAALESSDYVDYAEQLRLRRPVLQALADYAASTPSLDRRLREFASQRPQVDAYARFRAACEKLGRPWQSWSAREDSELRRGEDFDASAYLYHLNSQRLAFDQVEKLSTSESPDSPVLYLDMPLGVRGDGFDPWQSQDLFATGLSVGALPDAFFTLGQSWGFPPIKPEALRKDGYRYLYDSLMHIASRSGIIRIDHVMGMHRLYWTPDGMDARSGAYVQYHAEEMYALATLVSQRTGTAIVGEDLGSVPRYVGPAMRRHNLYRMYATYFNISPGERPAVKRPARNMFAYVDTHDMPAFAAFITGEDIDDRKNRGLLNDSEARAEKSERQRTVAALRSHLVSEGALDREQSEPTALLRALLKWLERSGAAMVIANLEDLWLESRPQNTPGTSTESLSWKGRATLSIDQFKDLLLAIAR